MRKQLEKLSFREDLELVGFEILTIKDLYENNDISLLSTTKVIRFYEIIFITDGKGEHQIDFKTYPIEKGNIIFLGKNQVHSWHKDRSNDGFIILFTEHFLYQNQVQFNDLSYAYPYNSILYNPVLKINDKSYFDTFLSLVELIQKEYALISYAVKQEVLQTLLRTLILKAKTQLPPEQLRADSESKSLFILFQKKLDEHIIHTRNANDFVDMTGASYYQLNSSVKEFTGISIKAFIDKTLLLKAKQLLSNPQLNINEVSDSLGFDEATNFSKFFKKITGNTPKHFKEILTKYS